jgi:uncharacterized protein (TIGR03382 family)
VALVALVAARAAHAQLLLADDWESGTMLKSDAPPGKWDSYDNPAAITLAPDGSAAHRGALGLLQIDTNPASSTGGQAWLSLNLAPHPDLYFRFWYRPELLGVAGNQSLISFGASGAPLPSYQLKVFPDGSMNQLGTNQQGGFPQEKLVLTLSIGQWYLIEGALTGLGSTAGARSTWVDGARGAQSTGIDLIGVPSARITFGEPHSVTGWTARGSYDDIRISTAPLASKLQVALPSQALAGDCIAATVALVDSVSSAPAPAPYPVVATVTIPPSAMLYADPSCAVVSSDVIVPAGQPSLSIGVRFAAADPDAEVGVSHLDFLGSSARLRVDLPQPHGYGVGCACGGAPALPSMILTAALLRRRRHRPRAPPPT